jgi:hypothetical protein
MTIAVCVYGRALGNGLGDSCCFGAVDLHFELVGLVVETAGELGGVGVGKWKSALGEDVEIATVVGEEVL